MKRYQYLFIGTLALVMLLPVFAFAQTLAVGFALGALLPLLLMIALYGLFFLVIRGIVLWYFRINDRIEQQEVQIELLKEIKDELKLLREKGETHKVE